MTEVICQGIREDDVTCIQLRQISERQDEMQQQVYIVAGVIGGALLIVALLIIAIFYKIHDSTKKIDTLNSRFPSRADELTKRGYSTYTAGPTTTSTCALYSDSDPISPNGNRRLNSRISPPHSYDNVVIDSAGKNAGGVRVLPRDPPPSRNINYDNY